MVFPLSFLGNLTLSVVPRLGQASQEKVQGTLYGVVNEGLLQ